MTEEPKILQILTFLCHFVTVSTDFVDWNVEKGQQGKTVLSSRLFEKFIAVFQVKMSRTDTENDRRTQNIPVFFVFMHFLLKFP